MAATQITVQAEISADVKKVWEYYTNPQHITKWNFASEDWHCPSASNDLQVGGKYTSRMEARDGSFGFDFTVIYSEVDSFKKLAYTMEDGRKANVQLVTTKSGTQITIVFDAENQHPVDMQQGGWQAILNNFKKYTENH